MKKDEIQTFVLPSGLRIVHVPTTSPVAWVGLAVNVGSRDDGEGQAGLAHFVEHTIFKGTTRRRSWHINNRMERVGGELNAYTTKECTTLYTVFPSKHLSRAVELLADLVLNSVFPEAELERELDVVLEEAASYRDSPADAVFDDFEDVLFAGSSLGHNILGIEEDLRTLTGAHCRDYLEHFFTPANMVLFSVGDYTPARLERLAERHFAALRRTDHACARSLPVATMPTSRTVEMGLHQSHTVTGARVAGMYSEERYALSLLSNILAGPGMNSLLNVQLRERHGLVYTVETSLALYQDCGALVIYFGCDHDKTPRAMRLIDHTIDHIAQGGITARQLDLHKRQLCGQMLVSGDSSEATAMGAGRSLLYYGHVTPLSEAIDHINAVTPEQLAAAAQQLAPALRTTLTLR